MTASLTQVLERSRKLVDGGRGNVAAKKKTARRATAQERSAASAHADEVARRNAAQDDVVVAQIRDAATEVHRDILKQSKPDLAFPVRSLKNVTYSASSAATSRSGAPRRCARSP